MRITDFIRRCKAAVTAYDKAVKDHRQLTLQGNQKCGGGKGIEVFCTECGGAVKVDSLNGGKTSACPHCKATLVVPVAGTSLSPRESTVKKRNGLWAFVTSTKTPPRAYSNAEAAPTASAGARLFMVFVGVILVASGLVYVLIVCFQSFGLLRPGEASQLASQRGDWVLGLIGIAVQFGLGSGMLLLWRYFRKREDERLRSLIFAFSRDFERNKDELPPMSEVREVIVMRRLVQATTFLLGWGAVNLLMWLSGRGQIAKNISVVPKAREQLLFCDYTFLIFALAMLISGAYG